MIEIPANKHWFSTGFVFEPGQKYKLNAQGIWHDDSIACTADGYKLQDKVARELWPLFKLVEPLRPLDTGDTWFQLVGKIGTSIFVIGSSCDFITHVEGELLCTANDCPFMYWNNHGNLQLTIEKN